MKDGLGELHTVATSQLDEEEPHARYQKDARPRVPWFLEQFTTAETPKKSKIDDEHDRNDDPEHRGDKRRRIADRNDHLRDKTDGNKHGAKERQKFHEFIQLVGKQRTVRLGKHLHFFLKRLDRVPHPRELSVDTPEDRLEEGRGELAMERPRVVQVQLRAQHIAKAGQVALNGAQLIDHCPFLTGKDAPFRRLDFFQNMIELGERRFKKRIHDAVHEIRRTAADIPFAIFLVLVRIAEKCVQEMHAANMDGHHMGACDEHIELHERRRARPVVIDRHVDDEKEIPGMFFHFRTGGAALELVDIERMKMKVPREDFHVVLRSVDNVDPAELLCGNHPPHAHKHTMPLVISRGATHTDCVRSFVRSVSTFTGLLASITLLGVGCLGQQAPTGELPAGGAYRSDDGGVTFLQKARRADGGGITGVTPIGVAIDPFDAQTLFLAGGVDGLFVTRNRGDVWTLMATPTASVTSIVMHPRNPNILYIAGAAQEAPDRSRIWKTFDRGETWEEIYAEPLGGRAIEGGIFQLRRTTRPVVMSLSLDPQSPEVLFAGSSSGALVVSRDGGINWSTRHTFPTGVSGLRLSPTVDNRLYVRLDNGTLGRSDDGGATAKVLEIRSGRTQAQFVHAVFLSPQDRNLVLVGTDNGIFRSRNAGESWEVVPLPVSENELVRVSTLMQGSTGVLWAGSNFNLYTSRDGGTTWRVRQFDIQQAIRFVVADPEDPNRFYVFFNPV